VTTDKIADGAVNTNDLAAGAVDMNRVSTTLRPGFARAWGLVSGANLAWGYNVTSVVKTSVGVFEITVVAPVTSPMGPAPCVARDAPGER
jgi:hypothetical protein